MIATMDLRGSINSLFFYWRGKRFRIFVFELFLERDVFSFLNYFWRGKSGGHFTFQRVKVLKPKSYPRGMFLILAVVRVYVT